MSNIPKKYPPIDFIEWATKVVKRLETLETDVEQHYQTMGQHIGALDTRLRRLEKYESEYDVGAHQRAREMLKELLEWIVTNNVNAPVTGHFVFMESLMARITHLSLKHGFGTI